MTGIIRKTGLLIITCAVALMMGLFASPPLYAQYTTASLSGRVVDPTGAAVPGAIVTAKNTGTGITHTVKTSMSGSYLFPALPVGKYMLSVSKTGFQTYVQSGIVLTVNQAATQKVSLKIGTTTEHVNVSGNAPLVTVSSPTTGQLVSQRSIVNLPLNGRQAQSLVFLIPGANDVTQNYCGVGCEGGAYPGEQYAYVNGGGPNGVNYQMDGASNNDTYMNTNLPFPDPDAIKEFNVQTGNMSAEYGNAASGIVNIVTKSGTNQFHGDVFEFLRNDVFDARNFFAPTRDTLKRNQFGATLGGPIVHNKLFFFGSYQGTRTRTAPNGQIAIVPTAAERQGNFADLCSAFNSAGLCTTSAINNGGTQLVNPNTGAPIPYNNLTAAGLTLSQPALNLLKYVPLPNGPGGELNYLGPAANSNDNQFLGKVDYYRGNHHLSGRYFYTKFTEPATPLGTNILDLNPNANQVRIQTVSVNDTYTHSPTLLFNTWFGWTQQNGGYIASSPFSTNALGVNIAPSPSPQIYVSVGSGGSDFIAQSANVGAYNRGDQTFREVITKIMGRNTLTFGGDLLRVRAPISNQYLQGGQFFFNGSYTGSNRADFMLGDAGQFMQGGGIYANITGYNWAAFAQDNWQATSRLMLNGGLRWTPYLPYTDSKNRLPCFRPGMQSVRYPSAPLGLLFAGDPGCPTGTVNASWGLFAPRLGFAYELTRDGKTSIRGGAGYYYQPPETLAWQDAAGVAPFAPIITINNANFADPFGAAGIPNPFPAQFGPKIPPSNVAFTLPTTVAYVFANNFQKPDIAVWNLVLERQLGRSMMVKLAYFGNKGTHLYPTSDQEPMADINPGRYIPGVSNGNNIQQTRPYPNFGPMGLIDSGYNSNYNAFDLSVEKRFTHGISFLADYTWSKAMNDFSESANNESYYQTNPFNRNFNYGPASSNIPNVFKFSGTYAVPHFNLRGAASKFLNGWQVAPIVTWQNGYPYSVMSGTDNGFTGDYTSRANFLGTSLSQAILDPNRSHGALVQEYFNTSLFGPNLPYGTFGTSGKNNLPGPGLFDTDLAILKDTKISERYTLQFRAEFYNAFNNVNFGFPDLFYGDSTFGQLLYTSTGPRIMQFALKVLF